MARQDSAQLADVLEVYLICLLLGFHGRYSAGEDGERQLLTTRVAERIQRIRGGPAALPPTWRQSTGPIGSLPPDPWIRRLAIAAAGIFLFALVLWLTFKLALGSAADEIRQLDTALRVLP
jgi:type VI secretion system protein ImpK